MEVSRERGRKEQHVAALKSANRWKPDDVIPPAIPRRLFYTLKRIVENDDGENTDKVQKLIGATCRFYTNNRDTGKAVVTLEKFIPELSGMVLGQALIMTEFGKDDQAPNACLRKVRESMNALKEAQKRVEELTVSTEMKNLKVLSLKAKYRRLKRSVRGWLHQLKPAPAEKNAQDHIMVKVHKKKHHGTNKTEQTNV